MKKKFYAETKKEEHTLNSEKQMQIIPKFPNQFL